MATTIITYSWSLLLFFIFSCLPLKTISQPRTNHMNTFCNNQSSNTFTRRSSYDLNLDSALDYLRPASSSSGARYLSVTKGSSPDTVYGMYQCRVDITISTCRICVRTAITKISRSCTYQKQGFIFYEECMVRYSDYSFFGLQESEPNPSISSPTSFPSKSRFGETLSDIMDQLIPRAASKSLFPEPYFSQAQHLVTESDNSYNVDSLVQCSPDIDMKNCTVCLDLAVQGILDCCSQARWAQIFLPKCLVRYNTSSGTLTVPPGQPEQKSLAVIKGNKLYERMSIAVITASALALVGL
ncbi:unnamed protein product [Cochlearia groenlandica]